MERGITNNYHHTKVIKGNNNALRLSYGVWLLQELLQHVPSNVTLYIMYDVACTLVKHLKRKCDNLLDYMRFALPSFHAYGHNASCQV